MPAGLTYPSLKVVLEFLDANKRTHIINRCHSSFKKVEQVIPFRVDHVLLQKKSITLNNIKRDEESTPPRKWKYLKVRDQNIVPGQTFSRPIPEEWTHVKSLIREMISKLLKVERKNTLLGYFENEFRFCSHDLRGLKFKVSNLKSKYVQDSLQLIHPSSAPLNYIEGCYPTTKQFRHHLIDSAKKLVINYCIDYDQSVFEQDKFPLHPNADVLFKKGWITLELIRKIVLNLKNNEYKVGVTLEFEGLQISVMNKFMKYAKQWLSATQAEIDASLDETLINNYSVIPRNRSTQVTTKSHIVIYDTVGKNERVDGERVLVLKIVPTDP